MEGSREEGAHFPDAAPEYVAHISEDGERVESVETHLRQVAQLASTFADDFGAASWAYAAGIAHDIGKFSLAFQRRILHDGPKVDHSTAGAAELSKYAAGMLSYCVAGHHGGLPNGGTILDDGGTLLGRLNAAERNAIPITQAIAMKSRYLAPMLRDSASFHRTTKAGRSARRS